MDSETIFSSINDNCLTRQEYKHDPNHNDIKKCCSCKRVVYISCLYHQQHDLANVNAEFLSFINGCFQLNEDYQITALLNDFHHILSYHDTDIDLEFIHSLLTTNCNVDECYVLNDNLSYFGIVDPHKLSMFQILDNCHRHLYHCFDFGLKCTQTQHSKLQENQDKNDMDDIDTDFYLQNLKQIISTNTKIQSLVKHKGGLEQIKENKYMTIIDPDELKEVDGRIGIDAPHEHEMSDHDIPQLLDKKSDYDENKIFAPKLMKKKSTKSSKTKKKSGKHKKRKSSMFYNSQNYRTNDELKVYSFGKKWYYDAGYKKDDNEDLYNGGKKSYWFVASKYKDLKTEILQNELYSLSINEWDIIISKAQSLIQCNKCKSMVPNSNGGEWQQINLNHIYSLLLYTDYDQLCKSFISTYRKLHSKESDKQWRTRHSQYSHLGKILKETVNKYGIYMHKISGATKNGFYHNISCKMILRSTMINFLGPTSLSLSINVILNYSIASMSDGLLLNLYPHYSITSTSTTLMDIGWICNGFSLESEFIMIGNIIPVKTNTIILPKICENYRYYLRAINILNYFIHNKHSEMEINKQIFKAISNLITNQCLRYDMNEETNYNQIQRNCLLVPKYIDKLFNFYINSIRSTITISIPSLMYNAAKTNDKKNARIVYGYLPLKPLFISGNDLIDIDLILTLFRKIKKLKLWCKDLLNLSDQLMNSILNFLAFQQNINTKIKDIELIKPSETQFTINEIIEKYQKRFHKQGWKLTDHGKELYSVLSIHKIKMSHNKRAKSEFTVKKKKKKKKHLYKSEFNLRPSLLPAKKQRFDYNSYL